MDNSPLANPLLTAEEVASRLSITQKTVYTMIREKRIPGAVRFGRHVRVRGAALEEWIAAGGDIGDSS